jgi:hypothetical protein
MSLFIIKYIGHKDIEQVHGIYTDLDKAKEEIIEIYETVVDYKYYEYKIDKYELKDKEYIQTKLYYTYSRFGFDECEYEY